MLNRLLLPIHYNITENYLLKRGLSISLKPLVLTGKNIFYRKSTTSTPGCFLVSNANVVSGTLIFGENVFTL